MNPFPRDTCRILEVFKNGNTLMMSLYPCKDVSSTLRRSYEIPVNFIEAERLTQEIVMLLNKADRKGKLAGHHFLEFKKACQLLWDLLIARQFKQELASAGSDLTLLIDEELVALPWELLYDGAEFLCLKHNMGRLVRTKGDQPVTVPAYRSSPGSNLRMLVLADPTDDLQSAYEEGLHIKNHFERRRCCMRIDFKSSAIDRLYVKKNFRDYDVVHFAGHCEYDAVNRHNTGWMLSDGRFTAHDILAMSSSVSLPSLVFSNACQSAHVPGDILEDDFHRKNYSLASAFLFAGVRHYLGTVRKIEDDISRHFARRFYENITDGFSVGESVRYSRLQVISEHTRETILWAGYVLYGNPAAVLVKGCGAKAQRRKPFVLSARRKAFAYAGGGIIALWLGVSAVIAAPTLRPDAYMLYLRSQRYFNQGNNDAALNAGRRVIAKDPMYLAAYPLIADTYQRLGDKDNTLKYYYTYCVNSDKKGDRKHLASAYSGLGWSYHLAGNYAKADEFYRKAAALSVQTKDKLNEAIALRRLAVLRTDQKNYDEALTLLTKSAEINRRFPHSYEHRYNLACDEFDIGLVFANKDDYTTARKFYTTSRESFEKLKCRRELSDCYFNIGELHVYEKEYQKAMDYYMKGLSVDQAQHSKFNLVTDYSMIGELYAEMESYAKAEEAFQESILLAQEIKSLPDEAYSLQQLGLVYKKTTRPDKARAAFQASQFLYRDLDPEKAEELTKELSALK